MYRSLWSCDISMRVRPAHCNICFIVKMFWYCINGGYLDFSHLTKLENIYIPGIYMRKENK